MGSTVIDGSLSSLLLENMMKPVSNVQEWLYKLTSILTRGALLKYGLHKAFDECDNSNSIISIKTEDNDMFGISHKMSITTKDNINSLLAFIDSTDNGNRVKVLDMMISECEPEQRIVVNILCNLQKFTENKLSSPSNSFVFIDYFTKDDGDHENCSCC
jgi:hypothetical protein